MALGISICVNIGEALGIDEKRALYHKIFRHRVANGIPTKITVQGYSMVPFFFPGDVVRIDKFPGIAEIGDIIVFRNGTQLVIHRVVTLKDDYILTKGDNNTWFDEPIFSGSVIGIYSPECTSWFYRLLSTIIGFLSRCHGLLYNGRHANDMNVSGRRVCATFGGILGKTVSYLNYLTRTCLLL